MEYEILKAFLGICSGGIYALLGISYVVIYKSTRVFPFSQAAVLIIGAYVMWYCLIVWHLPVWLGFMITCGAGRSWDVHRTGLHAAPGGATHPGPHRRHSMSHAASSGDRNPDGKRKHSGLWRILLARRGLGHSVSCTSPRSKSTGSSSAPS